MILEIALTIGAVLALGYTVNLCEDIIRKRNDRKMSFRESMDLAEMPVVTFYQGDKKFNFLLDTGSNYSHISKEAAKEIQGTMIDAQAKVSGIGEGTTSAVCRTTLSYKGVNYDIDLSVTDHLTDAFAAIKSETGVQVHGLIGNQFFQKHKYVLDFEELVAYSKK